MASAPRKSLASRAGAAARKVVSRGSVPDPKAAAAGAKKAASSAAASAKKAPAKQTQAKKAAAKKAPATNAPAKKAATKSTATKSAAKKAPVKKVAVKKVAVKKAPAKKAPAKKAPAKKTPAKAPATETPATKTPVKKTTVTEAPDRAVPATKAPAKNAGKSSTSATPGRLVVLEAEDPWTKAELKQVRVQLEDDVKRLTEELAEVEEDLAGMIENSGEGAGNDQADVGSASFERDQEMIIVNNARDMLEQSGHALERIVDGTYGKCEDCGNPIGKNRLMAFPRATLCLVCKQREERR